MANKIENIDQLRAEIKRLETKSAELKATLKTDVEGIKDYFKPLNMFFNAASWFAKARVAGPVFSSNGFGEGIRAIIAPFIDKVFGRISAVVEEFFKRRKRKAEPEDQ